ncbi:MAG: N-acetyltransferase [Acidimicrobiia bacterium]|nr:N-acetyltransferase [Acidimicrobiia bacterium]
MAEPEPEPEPPVLLDPDVEVPAGIATERFELRPLGPEHNAADHEAWSSSIDHIRATPGFGPAHSWPVEGMDLDQNRRDLEMHRRHFDERRGFTYTVLDAEDSDRVLGCVYLYADPTGDHPVEVRSWVSARVADLDAELRRTVAAWLRSSWPFESFRYAGLDPDGR